VERDDRTPGSGLLRIYDHSRWRGLFDPSNHAVKPNFLYRASEVHVPGPANPFPGRLARRRMAKSIIIFTNQEWWATIATSTFTRHPVTTLAENKSIPSCTCLQRIQRRCERLDGGGPRQCDLGQSDCARQSRAHDRGDAAGLRRARGAASQLWSVARIARSRIETSTIPRGAAQRKSSRAWKPLIS